MRVADIHPEHLIDKLMRGDISAAELSHLEAHLSCCSACRLELELRRDYQCQPPEGLAHAGSGVRRPRGVGGPWRTRRGQPARRLGRSILGLALLAAASSLAAGDRRIGWTAQEAARGGEPAPLSPVRPAPSKRAVHQPAGVPASLDAEPAPPRSRRAVANSPPTAPRRAEPRRAAHQAASGEPTPESAHTLFVAANHARRQGDAARATRIYGRLERWFPLSFEASVARLTLAQLHLDRGDAAAALQGFHHYLRHPTGGLEAEALVGSATALSRLGRRSEEVLAWQRVAQTYPGSAYARKASQRLRALRVP